MAFSISCLGGAEPNVAKLGEFERKEIVGKKLLQKDASRKNLESISSPGGDLLKIYSGSATEKPREKVLDTYSCYSPQVNFLWLFFFLGKMGMCWFCLLCWWLFLHPPGEVVSTHSNSLYITYTFKIPLP